MKTTPTMSGKRKASILVETSLSIFICHFPESFEGPGGSENICLAFDNPATTLVRKTA